MIFLIDAAFLNCKQTTSPLKNVLFETIRQFTYFHSETPRGVLVGILGGGVPPGSPNPDLISEQKM